MNAGIANPLQRAQALLNVRRHREALACIADHLASDPDSVDAHVLKCWCHRGLDEPHDAERAARTALQNDPSSHRAMYVLSVVQRERLDQARQALDTINRAIELDPKRADYHTQKAFCNLSLFRNNEVLNAAQEALALDPEHCDAHWCRIRALTLLGRHAEAERTIEQALALHPEAGRLHFLQAMARLRRGDSAGSRQSLLEAQRLDPGEASYYAEKTAIPSPVRWQPWLWIAWFCSQGMGVLFALYIRTCDREPPFLHILAPAMLVVALLWLCTTVALFCEPHTS